MKHEVCRIHFIAFWSITKNYQFDIWYSTLEISLSFEGSHMSWHVHIYWSWLCYWFDLFGFVSWILWCMVAGFWTFLDKLVWSEALKTLSGLSLDICYVIGSWWLDQWCWRLWTIIHYAFRAQNITKPTVFIGLFKVI